MSKHVAKYVPIRNDLKDLLQQANMSMTELVALLNEKNGTKVSLSNFSAKLRRGTIKYNEVEEILDILGYEIVWRKKGEPD